MVIKGKSLPTPSSTGLLPILAYCVFLVGLDALLVIPLIPTITASTHTPADDGGLLLTAYALFYGLSAPLFGPVSDRWGRKKLMVLGLTVFGIGTMATGFGTSFSELLLFRGIAGIGGAMTMPTIFATVGDSFPYEQRGKAMGIVMGSMIGSTVLGVPCGSVFAYLGSWQWSFWGVGIMAAVALVIVMVKLPAVASDAAEPLREAGSSGALRIASKGAATVSSSAFEAYRKQFRTAFTNPSVFFALLSTFLWMAGIQGMFAYVGVFYTQNFGFNAAQIGMVLVGAGLGNVFGNVLGGRLSDKVGKQKVIAVAAMVAAVAVVSFSLLTHVMPAAVIVHIIWSTACGFGQAPLTALVSELSPMVRGTVLSLNSSAMYMGMMASTAVSTALLAVAGFTMVGVICGIASLAVWPIIGFVIKEGAVRKNDGVAV